MRWRSLVALAAALWLGGCDDSVVVQLRTGPQRFEVSADALALPAALEDATGAIASVPCGPLDACPSSEAVPIACERGVCDPAPHTLDGLLGEVVDVDLLAAEAVEILGTVEAIEIVGATYQVLANALTHELPEVEVLWAPEGAVAVDPAIGAPRLGALPAVSARATPSGAVALDPAGVAALSEYLVHTSRRVRFFGRTRVDLAPGDPFPAGSAVLTVDLTVRVTGSLR